MAVYQFDDNEYTDKATYLEALQQDWFRPYTSELVQQVISVGAKLVVDGCGYTVLQHLPKQWILLQGKGFTIETHARKILDENPELRLTAPINPVLEPQIEEQLTLF